MPRTDRPMLPVVSLYSFIILLYFALSALAHGTTETLPAEKPPLRTLGQGDKFTVYRIDINEDIISADVPFFIHRASEAAKHARADAVIFNMDTNGGRVDLMQEILDDLIKLPMPTYSYINNKAISAGALLAVTADKVIMSPTGRIGGATAISGTGAEIPESVNQKIVSILKADIRSTAKYKGHPVLICEAFVDKDIDIPGLKPKGQVLTMDQDQATTTTTFIDPKTSQTITLPPLAAYIAKDTDEMLQRENIWPAQVLSYQMTWSEKLAKMIMSFKAIILLVGLAALFLEIKSPGMILPAVIGVIALALFFWGSYLADMASFIDVALFFFGLVLLLLEIFVIPGFGVAGVAGITLMVVGLILAMIKLPPPNVPDLSFNYSMLTRALWTVVLVFIAMIPLFWALAKFLPSAPGFRRLILNPQNLAEADAETAALRTGQKLLEPVDLIGKTGEAVTILRPAGMAIIDGQRVDVVTQGDYIEKGTRIRVIEVQGNVNVVVRDEIKPDKPEDLA